MLLRAVLTTIVLLGAVMGAGFAANPELLTLQPDSKAVRLGLTTIVRVQPESELDPLWTYEWSANRGTIEALSDFHTATYMATDTLDPGWDVVTVTVSQNSQVLVTRSVVLLVYKQFIMLKADDYQRHFWGGEVGGVGANWDYYFNYLINEKHIKTSAGMITDSLDTHYPDDDPPPGSDYNFAAFVAYTTNLINSHYVEIFHHGYDHSFGSSPTWYEFWNTSYTWQKQHLEDGQTLARNVLGFPLQTFGAPFNMFDATTTTVLDEDLDLKVVYFGDDSDPQKMVLGRQTEIELGEVGVPDFAGFLATYEPSGHYLALQHHPDFQTFRDNFDEFRQIIDYLIAQKVTFILPAEYYHLMIDGILPLDPGADIAPIITVHPVSRSVDPNSSVTFSVTVTGSTPLNYQWKKGTAEVSGATGSSYTISSAQQTDEGSYSVVVSNPAGTVTSDPATLTVSDPPVVTTHPVSLTVNPGSLATFTVVVAGTAPFSYQWRKDGSALSGATNAALAISSAAQTDEGQYACYVSNSAGTATGQNVLSNAAGLTVNDPVQIDVSPGSQTVNYGADVLFSVTASGTSPLSYQWRENMNPIGGATGSTYSLTAVSNANEGVYDCVVTNMVDGVPSASATLTVRDPIIAVQPTDAIVLAGSPALFNVTAHGSGTLTYQWYKGGAPLTDGGNITGASSAALTVANAIATDEALYYCDVIGADGAVPSNVVQLSVNDPAIVTHPQSQSVDPDAPVEFTVAAAGTAPFSYQWLKDGSALDGATDASFTIAHAQQTDEGLYSCVVTNGLPAPDGTATSNAATLSVNDPPVVDQQPQSQSVDPTDPVTFAVTLAEGTPPISYQWRKGGVNIGGETRSTFHISWVVSGNEGAYSCYISNSAGHTTSATATLSVNVPPTITTQPSNTTADPGDPVTFTIVATGTMPLSYQWRKNGLNLLDETHAIYSLASAQQSDEGSYTCLVSNTAGTKLNANPESAPATLTVNDPPVFVEQPESQIAAPGYSVSFSVVVSGTNPLAYQWKKGGEDVAGATEATYTISSVSQTDGGTYRCHVQNSAGENLSNPAILTVYDPVKIVTQPVSQTVNYGVTVQFSVPATGTPLLYFQWKRNAVNLSNGGRITGADTAVLQIAIAANADEGVYTCQVRNMFGAITSDPASLTVHDPALTAQPQDQIVFAGSTATFSVTAVGSAVTYLWYRNTGSGFAALSEGGNITGAAAPDLTVTNCQSGDEGAYHCVVSGGPDPALTSDNAALTLSDPALLAQPQSQTVNPGQPVSLWLLLDPASHVPISYRWSKDNVAIPGASGVVTIETIGDPVTFTIDAATQDDEGVYTCELHGIKDITSNPATLSVNDPPVLSPILVDPPTGHIYTMGNPSFTVQRLSGTEPVSYQWRKDGTDLVDSGHVGGAHNPTLTISLAVQEDEGNYVCEATNMAGTTVTNPVHLLVGDLLEFTQPLPDVKQYIGEDAQFTVNVTGGRGTPHYLWKFDSGRKTWTPRGDDAPTLTIHSVTEADAGNYWCDVTDLRGTYSSNTSVLEVAPPLQITAQPQGATKDIGAWFALNVGSTGGFQPITYEWWKDGVPSPLGTGPTYTISFVQIDDAGRYYAVVTDSNASVFVSDDAVLTVNVVALPAAGIAGLGLLAGLCVLGAVRNLRRRK